jgi:hypothetical protein
MFPAVELNFPNPVETRADLFDRDAELQLVLAALRSVARRPIVIMGERVMGKTSLLNVAAEAAAVDLRRAVLHLPHVEDRDGFAEELLEGIAGEVGTSLYREGLRDGNGDLRLSTSELVGVAGELSARRGDGGLLLCLEELDSMLVKCPGDGSAQRLLDLILELVTSTSLPLELLCTMTRTDRQLLGADAGPLVRAACVARLEPWSLEATGELVSWLFKGTVTLPRDAQETLYAACGGHPYLTKAVLQALRGGEEVTTDRLRAAIAATVASPELDFTLENIVKVHLSPAELRLLVEVAGRGGRIDGPDLRALGDRYPEVALRLQRRGYLRPSGDQGCAQAYGLLGQWLLTKPWAAAREA